MATVLFIHGINNQDNSKDNIEKTWSDALREGTGNQTLPADTNYTAAFYGDILYEETGNWNKNEPAVRPMSAASPDEDYADDAIAALYLEYQQAFGLTDAQVAQHLDAADERQAHQRMAKGVHKRWLKAIAVALEHVSPAKGKYVVRAFLRQAAAYLHKPGLKEKIDDLVRDQVLDELSEEGDVVIISHSLGTIVAYDLMRRLRHQVRVKLLLTAGSPLGIEIVKRRLGPPLICLPNVENWVNVSDKEDFVALRPKLTLATFGCDKVENIDHVDNGADDAHDILKYLAHDVVAQAVKHGLSRAVAGKSKHTYPPN